MSTRKILLSSCAIALGLALTGLAGASPDTPAAVPSVAPASGDASPTAEKACCQHHAAAGEKSGMHCDHAKMKPAGEEGKAACPRHAAMHPEGASADGKACCAKHAGMMKSEASGDAKTCCAQHAAMHKDGAKSGCCCCDGEACPHHAAAEAPAKS